MLKNANQIAVSHPSDRCDDSSLLKISPPSVHVNLNVPTITERWVEKNSLHYLLIRERFHFKGKPLWPTLSRNAAVLKLSDSPVTSETSFEEFPYVYTNARVC